MAPPKYNLQHVTKDYPFMTCLVKVNSRSSSSQKTVAKVLNKCHGVYSFRMDNDVVEISGTVDPDLLLKMLGKAGNKAELQWFQFGECSSNLFMPTSHVSTYPNDGRYLHADNLPRPKLPSNKPQNHPTTYDHGYGNGYDQYTRNYHEPRHPRSGHDYHHNGKMLEYHHNNYGNMHDEHDYHHNGQMHECHNYGNMHDYDHHGYDQYHEPRHPRSGHDYHHNGKMLEYHHNNYGNMHDGHDYHHNGQMHEYHNHGNMHDNYGNMYDGNQRNYGASLRLQSARGGEDMSCCRVM